MSDQKHSRRLQPYQFGMRGLLLATAGFGVVFALMKIVGVIASLAAVWVLSLVTVHVLANAWGTRMRNLAGRRAPASAETTMEQMPYSTQPAPCFAAATCLRDSIGVGRTTLVVSFVGWAVCGILGTAVLAFGLFGRVGIAGVVVGGVSASVVGAMAGFIASSFVEHTKRAWKEAAHPQASQSSLTGVECVP